MFLNSTFGHGFILYALQKMSATTVGITGSLQVIYAPIFTFLLLGIKFVVLLCKIFKIYSLPNKSFFSLV